MSFSPGTFCGKMSSSFARQIGIEDEGDDNLPSVGTSLIDAHAGFLGMLASTEARFDQR